MPTTSIINYSDESEFSYDDTLIEFNAGQMCLLNQFDALGPDRIIAGRLLDNTVAFSDAPATFDLQNGATFDAGTGLNLTGNFTNRRMQVSGSGNMDQIDSTGCIYLKFIPDFNGTPSSPISIFAMSDNSGYQSNQPNYMNLELQSSGFFRLSVRDNAGSYIINNHTFDFYSFVQGSVNSIQLNIDFSSGNTRLYVNGVQLGGVLSATGTRDGANYNAIGSDQNGRTDHYVRDFFAFSEPQPVLPISLVPPTTDFATSDPVAEYTTPFTMDSLISFADTSTNENPPLTDVRFILNISGIDTYWDGLAWVSSDGSYAQSNDAVDIDANASSLDLTGGKDVRLKVILHSNDGSQTPCSDQTTLVYSLSQPSDVINTCSINFSTVDLFGKPVNNTEIIVEADDLGQTNSNSVVFKGAKSFTNYNGLATLSVTETATTNTTATIKFRYLDVDGIVKERKFTGITIPNQSSVNFVDLI